ncbi:hypothetical protein Clacol_000556 [Clathrus columnatus]|uniref:pH-response regulator protein palC n=1 Tax=Clathrus columnatus TaxID=1419009 RepID=A0AAV5A034_9AGAM|nr:hypothetical protein Clacol_000556 [Clathrus columnatus]
MSWSGFKKTLNRGTTTLMQKTGQVERTIDREFADEEAKYKIFEKETNSLQKDSKTYIDSLRAMAAAQSRLAETIDIFYGSADRTSEGAMAANAYKRAIDELEATVTRELEAPYRTTIQEPVGKMCAYFSAVNDTISKRNKKVVSNEFSSLLSVAKYVVQLLDYDAARNRLRKAVDKPGEDPTKLPKAQQEHDEAKEIFEALNEQVLNDLPQLLDLRIPYFDPSFEAMIRMQIKFAEEGYEKLGAVQRYFPDNVRDDYASGQLDAQFLEQQMECYRYELPTTGVISFTENCLDELQKYSARLFAATSARASLRTVLKESKHTGGEKDYLKVVKTVEDYLPHLHGIMKTVESLEISFSPDLTFSWRTTLGSNVFQHNPRISVVGFPAEMTFTLLTYAFALSNLARSAIINLGDYERNKHILETERKIKDEKLQFAMNLLCRASGLFSYIAQVVLPKTEILNPEASKKIPDMNRDVIGALSSLALADAHRLAIRKTMTKAVYETTLSPGPPLPKSHPFPALIAKLYIHCASCYSSARSLAKTFGDGDVSSDLQKYLTNENSFTLALAYKWLGVDAGESGSRAGIAVGFLNLARTELESSHNTKKSLLGKGGDIGKENKLWISTELDSVTIFLKSYRKLNDTVYFQPVPSKNELQSLVPTGTPFITMKQYEPPKPSFEPETTNVTSDDIKESSNTEETSQGSYALAGSYF